MSQAKALVRLRFCAGWSEHLLVAHTTLLEISCHGSFVCKTPQWSALIHKMHEAVCSTSFYYLFPLMSTSF